MNGLIELKERFSLVFSPEQATVLADAIHSSYDQLVKASDFQELKGITADLGQVQKRTEEKLEKLIGRIDELAVAQNRTEMKLEKLTDRVDELAVAQNRTEVKLEKLTDRVDELAVAQNRTEDKLERLAESHELLSREVRNLARQVGGLSEAFGASLEDFALDLVPELLEKYWNLKVIECSREEVKLEGKSIEFDLYIEGFIDTKKIIVLGEVKSHITKDEVLKFFKLVEKVQPVYGDAEIRVVFFGYRAYKEVKELISSLGGYMIFSNTRKL